MVPNQKRASGWAIPGAPGEEASERLSPCPLPSPGEGPGCLPIISTPSTAPGLPAAPGNIPSERRREARCLMDLSPRCRPAPPAPHPVICFHQERCPSVSASSQLRARRAGHPGRRSCLSSPTNDLGPGWEELGRNSNSPGPHPAPTPCSPGLSPLPPATSPRVNLHLGPFQTKLDSWELWPLMGLRLPLDSVSYSRSPPPPGVVWPRLTHTGVSIRYPGFTSQLGRLLAG